MACRSIVGEFASLGADSKPDTQSLLVMLGLSLVIASLSRFAGESLAGFGLFNPMIWARLAGSDEVSGIMLYLIVALIGAEVSLGAIMEAPVYILSGFMILSVHGVLLLFVARLLRVDLHLAGIASIASIGSAPSAAVVGAAYGKNLVPIAVIPKGAPAGEGSGANTNPPPGLNTLI